MKFEFSVDYEILQKRHSPTKDLCINKDGLITVLTIDLEENLHAFKNLRGEAILSDIVNRIFSIKYRVQKNNNSIIFYCNHLNIRFYLKSDKVYIDVANLEVPDNDLFAFYGKYKDIFDKLSVIFNCFI